MSKSPSRFKDRFRGFLPIIVDMETGGVDPKTSAVLEICAVLLEFDTNGHLKPADYFFEHVLPFEGSILDAKSLEFNQIDPYQPLRLAVDEKTALTRLFVPIQKAIKTYHCQRAVLVGHNAWFDLLFLNAAIKRCKLNSPFHAFTCFDTATLGGIMYGQTVLAKAAQAAGISFDPNEAHSAIYDAQKTAELFCTMVNLWKDTSGM